MRVSRPTDAGELLAGALRSEGRRVRFRRGQALFIEGDVAERVLEAKGYIPVSCTPGAPSFATRTVRSKTINW